MHFLTTVFILACTLILNVSCFYTWIRPLLPKYEETCPKRVGADGYYFGTTHLRCIMEDRKGRRRRRVPSRFTMNPEHRFIEYKGYYYDFQTNSKVSIANSRLSGDVCPGAKEASPAGYSELSTDCIEGCAKNYACYFGNYSVWFNNCNHFANRLSKVLCRRGTTCPDWCTGSCDDVEYN